MSRGLLKKKQEPEMVGDLDGPRQTNQEFGAISKKNGAKEIGANPADRKWIWRENWDGGGERKNKENGWIGKRARDRDT